MANIEINTAQNVKIEYQLAGVGQRIFAFAVDFIVLFIVYLILAWGMMGNHENFIYYFLIVLIVMWVFFYTLISEIIGNGQTIGKRALGIKVVKLNGDEMEFYDYFTRWSMRLLDIYFSIGVFAMLLISSNKNGQRTGDIIAGTTVIKKKSNYGFQLNDILNLNKKKKEDYTFEYPNAYQLNEKDVILIKNLLYRQKQYKNNAHNDAVIDLSHKVAEVLGIENIPNNKVQFLNKIISEYIVLTR